MKLWRTELSEALCRSVRTRFPKPEDDDMYMRMQLMVEALAQAIQNACTTESIAVAREMERASLTFSSQSGFMRAADHQFQQPLVVGVMDRKGNSGVKFDVEGSGHGFRVI
jgi:branched-chain amino acid transport system substrate-binding protein